MSAKNWYKVINKKNPLTQGDIIFDCKIVKPNFNTESDTLLEGEVLEYDVIILSQSCDLVNKKIEMALVSPIFTLSQIAEVDPSFEEKKKREKLRKGEYPSYHLLDKPTQKGFLDDFFVVDFHKVFGVPISYVKDHLTNKHKRRLTLISPYKEHLSQAFARYFMRVGLPSDIPTFIT